MTPRLSAFVLAAAFLPTAGCKNVTSLLGSTNKHKDFIQTMPKLSPDGHMQYQVVDPKTRIASGPVLTISFSLKDLDLSQKYTVCDTPSTLNGAPAISVYGSEIGINTQYNCDN